MIDHEMPTVSRRLRLIRFVYAALVAAGIGLVVGPQQLAAQPGNPQQWQAPQLTDHELVGRIWSSESQDFIDAPELYDAIVGARYLLLGEKHDNPDHHVLQLLVLRALITEDRVDNVAFEMLDSSVQERLLDLDLQQSLSDDELKAYLMWDDDGWDWAYYGPLVQLVYASGIEFTAGNIDRQRIGEIYASEATPAVGVLDEAAMAQLRLDIDESHCGLLPESQFPAMVRVQQARDQAMASSMAVPEADSLSVLIAGNYHARRDLGVVNYLLASQPSLSSRDVIALSFMEVQEGESDPQSYAQSFSSQEPYDFIWFTPSVGEVDYCATIGQ